MGKGFAPVLPTGNKAQLKPELPLTSINEIQASLLTYLQDIPDPRVSRTQKHLLTDILAIAILAVIAGAEGWEDMENYGLSKQSWLSEFWLFVTWYGSIGGHKSTKSLSGKGFN
ncbi:transposase family protein [Microcystis aeruginosa]|jgi:hypothetical protein|uniref:Transposase n=1 Tax=Microcystis aeruginosa SPC777 TaxID=482300 RepID=S3IWM3_MICAE|nr:Transposase [Microcystis aeruginosa SPC777]